MKNFNLTLLALLFSFFAISCDNDDLIKPTEEPTPNKALIPPYGYIEADIIEIASRGWVRIYNSDSPCLVDGVPVPCDPLMETVVPCRYPNGFCYVEHINGTSNPGPYDPVTGVSVDEMAEVKKGVLGTITVVLPERDLPAYEHLLRQLNSDEEVKADNKEELAEAMLNSFSISKDSPLSDELVRDFREKAENPDFEQMFLLAGDYKIHYDEAHPYGYIQAYVMPK